jgi:hypothetical protein
MSRIGKITGCLPSKQQEFLLKAALLKGDAAIDAWAQWKSHIDLDRIDHDSSRLLPLLYKNLSSLGMEDPLIDRFRGSHKKAWYKNQVLLHHMSILLHLLEDKGIRTMILKGAPLTLLYYPDYGLRPMEDIDVMVPVEKALEASNLLIEWGWKPRFPSREMKHEIYFSCRHAHGFEDDTGKFIDLHWHALYECSYSHADDSYWDAAVLVKIDDGLTTLTLCPADLLLHTIVHGIRWNPQPLLRWVADVMMIINSGKEIDWERFVMMTIKYNLVLYVRNGLLYIKELLDAPIPAFCMEEIQRIEPSYFEKREYRILNLTLGPFNRIFVKWFRYSRYKGDVAVMRRMAGIPSYLQAVWGTKHLWQVPFYLVYKFYKLFVRTKVQPGDNQ